MNWIKLNSAELADEVIHKSKMKPQIIFKHSTRCSISAMAFGRLRPGIPNVDYYLVDVIAHRDISNLITQKFNVSHQSPQLLIINMEKCVFDTSHFDISIAVMEREINLLQQV